MGVADLHNYKVVKVKGSNRAYRATDIKFIHYNFSKCTCAL